MKIEDGSSARVSAHIFQMAYHQLTSEGSQNPKWRLGNNKNLKGFWNPTEPLILYVPAQNSAAPAGFIKCSYSPLTPATTLTQFQWGRAFCLIPSNAQKLRENDWSRTVQNLITGPSVLNSRFPKSGGPIPTNITIDDFAQAIRQRCITWFTLRFRTSTPNTREKFLQDIADWVGTQQASGTFNSPTPVRRPPHEMFFVLYCQNSKKNPLDPALWVDKVLRVLIALWDKMSHIDPPAPRGYIGNAISMPFPMPQAAIKEFKEAHRIIASLQAIELDSSGIPNPDTRRLGRAVGEDFLDDLNVLSNAEVEKNERTYAVAAVLFNCRPPGGPTHLEAWSHLQRGLDEVWKMMTDRDKPSLQDAENQLNQLYHRDVWGIDSTTESSTAPQGSIQPAPQGRSQPAQHDLSQPAQQGRSQPTTLFPRQPASHDLSQPAQHGRSQPTTLFPRQSVQRGPSQPAQQGRSQPTTLFPRQPVESSHPLSHRDIPGDELTRTQQHVEDRKRGRSSHSSSSNDAEKRKTETAEQKRAREAAEITKAKREKAKEPKEK